MTVTGIGNYSGTKDVTLRITDGAQPIAGIGGGFPIIAIVAVVAVGVAVVAYFAFFRKKP